LNKKANPEVRFSYRFRYYGIVVTGGFGGFGGTCPSSPPVSFWVLTVPLSLLLLCAGHENARKSAKKSSNMIKKFKE
jgi:hypothetical protein